MVFQVYCFSVFSANKTEQWASNKFPRFTLIPHRSTPWIKNNKSWRSVFFGLSERRIPRALIHFRALEAINFRINSNPDFGFNHIVSGVDLWSRWLKSLGLYFIAKIWIYSSGLYYLTFIFDFNIFNFFGLYSIL